MNAMSSLRANSALITKVSFPREIIPLSIVFSGLFDFVVTFVVMIVLNLFFGFFPNERFIYIPAIILVEILFIVNLSLLLTVFTIARRDLSYVVTYFINLYMFLTPVFYPVNVLPQELQQFYFLNPMGAIIDAFKNVVFYNHEPRWFSLFFSTSILIVLFFFSYKIFKRAEKTFADVL